MGRAPPAGRELGMLRTAGLVLIASVLAPVCNIPVFRYALERWRPDAYQVHVFHQGPLSAAERALVDELRGSEANIDVERVDLAETVPPTQRKIWEAQDRPGLPWVAVHYPRTDLLSPPAWTGRLEAESVHRLVDSP